MDVLGVALVTGEAFIEVRREVRADRVAEFAEESREGRALHAESESILDLGDDQLGRHVTQLLLNGGGADGEGRVADDRADGEKDAIERAVELEVRCLSDESIHSRIEFAGNGRHSEHQLVVQVGLVERRLEVEHPGVRSADAITGNEYLRARGVELAVKVHVREFASVTGFRKDAGGRADGDLPFVGAGDLDADFMGDSAVEHVVH